MSVKKAQAQWRGGLKKGKGHVKTESGALDAPHTFGSRFEDEPHTNPEELIGAAHASCYVMALSMTLGEQGFTPDLLDARAEVTLEEKDAGFRVTKSVLHLEATIPDIDASTFNEIANKAFEGCPISNALDVEKTLHATLK